MAMLDDILNNAQPGNDPRLGDMIAKMMMGSGASPGQAQAGVQGLSPPAMQSTLGTAPGAAQQPGATPPMDPAEANQTLRILIQKGVPPAVAQQALTNPSMLKELLAQIFRQTGPQEAPRMMASSPNRMSAPPLGGGGGYQ